MKVAAPAGAIVVYGLDGKIRQTIGGIDRPNNVDVEYGFRFGGQSVDIAVAKTDVAECNVCSSVPQQQGALF